MASSAADSPEVYTSPEEVAEELEYQKVLLLSLGDHVQGREQAEVMIKAEIRMLEQKLKALRKADSKPNSSASVGIVQPYVDDPFGPLSVHPTQNHKMEPELPISSTASPHVLASSSSNLLSPSQLNLPTRKRLHGDHLGLSESENKFRRTSPSPHITRSTTPSTSAFQNHRGVDDGFLDLTADDETVQREIAKVRRRQKEAEEKANRERDDAEFARKLQDHFSADLSPPNTFSPAEAGESSGLSAFDRLLGRPLPGSSQNLQPGNPRTSSLMRSPFHAADPASTLSVTANRPPAGPGGQGVMPGTFRDSESDSEIEIISQNAFRNDKIYPPTFGVYSHGPSSLSSSAYNQPSHATFPSAIEATSQTAMRRIADHNQQFETQPRHLLANHGHPGAMSSLPTSMNSFGPSQIRGPLGHVYPGQYTPYQGIVAPGSNAFTHSPSFSVPSDSAGLSALGSFSNQDPLARMILHSNSYNIGSMVDIYGNPLDPTMSAELSDYVHDPRRTAQEIHDLLENIRPDVEIPKEDREGTPDGLKYALYEHQKLALTWLKQMEEGSNKGGILADDMGLGKTISALALILSRPSEDKRRRTTLIVGPVALVRQWEREIATKIKPLHRLSTYLYHSGRKAHWETLRTYDVVLTTYGTLAAEFKRWQDWNKKCEENPQLDRGIAKNKFPFLGEESHWYRVILDEAQCIKNKATKAAQGACHLKARTRFCLTGTPMMNGVHELYSLIHFLRIRPYNDQTRFTSEFGCLSKSGGSRGSIHPRMEKNAMKKLQAVLKAILLRRTKTSEIDGKPILTLPEKTEEILHAIFNEDEQAYYTALETKTRLQFNKYVKANTIGKNYSNILVLLLRLRQAACHPHLIMDFEEAPPEASVQDMVSWAKSLLPDVIRRIIAATVPFECPVCYDPVPNPRIVIPCGHDTCSECLVRIAGNVVQEAIAEGNEAGDAKCPTCRGKIDMAKIIDYETFKQVHMTQIDQSGADDEETQSEDDGDSIDESDTDSSESGSEASDEDIRNFVVPDGYRSSDEDSVDDENDDDDDDQDVDTRIKRTVSGRVKNEKVKAEPKDEEDDNFMPVRDIKPEAREEKKERVKSETCDDDDDDFVLVKDIRPAVSKARNEKKVKTTKKPKRQAKGKGKKKVKAKKDPAKKHTSLATLKREASRSAEGRRRYMRYLRKNWVSSAKVDKCLDILRDTEPDVKTIIFSQFTTLLDLLEVPVKQEKWGFMRYDGSMSADARHHAVVQFTDDPRCKVMLVSLKAGNAGLNLVAASQVIILDPFWNPFIEMQAVDRAHRIGQQKPVKVHRILVQNTVEDRIIELQNKKRKLVEAALDEKASQGVGRLGQQELIYLFNGGAERETAPRPAHVYAGLGGGAASSPSSYDSD